MPTGLGNDEASGSDVCLPTKAPTPPSGEMWLHEIKHDGFRVIARKNGKHVRLYSRPGNDLTYRFPLIVESVARLRPRSCIIDGESRRL
jgi:bifunctional non-homologous end joining protein LigD